MRGDQPTERQLRRDETGYTGGLWEWPSRGTPRVDCLEGQRPRLTYFSSAGGAESLSDTTPAEFTTERLRKVWTKLTELTELSE
jgi:hypothetical protein